ncbi:SAM dependent carboxyl methyltransferase [Corchorus olitorius]|uniref:SAM dependent carboxyl methyltransferase n=1 Tax=Corchorus olitorius TaxID=93759 RepID=A0A1R3I0T1_9ROSI|nr:SAM dependent carboxyl methyltransferase [Corchorus olitorius]
MEVKEMLFMNKGDGENSYAKSAEVTEKVAAETQAIVYKVVESVLKEKCGDQILNIADLGCAADEKGLPLNKGRIYISESTPPAILKAYVSQFEEDFLLFLKCRSPEMVPNGRIILIINARKSDDPIGRESIHYWELLSKAIVSLVSQGLIGEEELDSFNVPIHTPSQDEVEELVKKEGSFTIEFIELLDIDLAGVWSSPQAKVKTVRAFSEPLISHQFGDKKVMDKLYDKVTEMLIEDYKKEKPETMKNVSLVAVLKKKDTLT